MLVLTRCAAGALLAFGLACGGDDPTEPPDYSGAYALESAGGGSLPRSVTPFTHGTLSITGVSGGVLRLIADASCTIVFEIFFQTDDGLHEPRALNLPCSYTQAGSALSLQVEGSVRPTTTGTVGAGTITVDLGSPGFGVVVFRKAFQAGRASKQ